MAQAAKQQDQPHHLQPQQQQPGEWDMASLNMALKQLKDLYLMVRGLRSALPRIMEPLTPAFEATTHPIDVINEFQTRIYTISQDIASLKETLESPQIKAIMSRAQQSGEQNPGFRPWWPREEPDWADIK